MPRHPRKAFILFAFLCISVPGSNKICPRSIQRTQERAPRDLESTRVCSIFSGGSYSTCSSIDKTFHLRGTNYFFHGHPAALLGVCRPYQDVVIAASSYSAKTSQTLTVSDKASEIALTGTLGWSDEVFIGIQ